MPRSDRKINYPAWVDKVDSCAADVVREALRARESALAGGAMGDRTCRRLVSVGDKILSVIQAGKVTGDAVCAKAAVAVRKFNTAVECSHPTTRKSLLGGVRVARKRP